MHVRTRIAAHVHRGMIHVDRAGAQHAVLLAGSARSGTTWFQDFFGSDAGCRIMFEPFDSRRISSFAGWNVRQYIPRGDRSPEFSDPADAVISGRIRHPWVDQFNRSVLPNFRLIKEVRVNLALAWIAERFPEIPLVFVLRHPFAVASSRIALKWPSELGQILAQERLRQDFLDPHMEFLSSLTEEFECHVAMWCVENYVPLVLLGHQQALVSFYEDAVTSPAAEMTRLDHYLRSRGAKARMSVTSSPSAMSRSDSAVATGRDPLTSWFSRVSRSQVAGGLRILHRFGLDRVYSDAPLPALSAEDLIGALGSR